MLTSDNNMYALIYEHYSGPFTGMSAKDRISLGSGFRMLHEAATALRELHLEADSIPVQGWQQAIGLDYLKDHGYDLKFEIWMAIGPVGQLAQLIDECKYLCPDDYRFSVSAGFLNYAILPDSQGLFKDRIVAREWMECLRRLRERCAALDVGIQSLTTSPVELQFLLFHGYLVGTLLHQALNILEFAELLTIG
jgi:hypothetical protein